MSASKVRELVRRAKAIAHGNLETDGLCFEEMRARLALRLKAIESGETPPPPSGPLAERSDRDELRRLITAARDSERVEDDGENPAD